MANRKQLAILKQGVDEWNKWREDNPDVEIDLRGTNLIGLDLSGANFRKADVRGTLFGKSVLKSDFTGAIVGEYNIENICHVTDFSCSDLTSSVFDNILIFKSARFHNANLAYTSWSNIRIDIDMNIVKYFYQTESIYNKIVSSKIELKIFNWVENIFKKTLLDDYDVFMLLIHGRCCQRNLSLKDKNLKAARLVNFDLHGVDLRESNLLQADLSGANITGAKLYGSARENWIIDGIRCEYVYWDEAGESRTPPNRNFRPGEFEELYRQLPTFEYVFANGFTPLDPLIMDRVVQAINERNEEFSLELINFDKRGEPHATFTVCHLDYVEKAKEQITAGYERNRIEPEQQDQLMAAFLGLIENQSKSLDIIKQLGGEAMGDTYNINGGQIGAIGKKALAAGNTFQQITADLSRLHEEMRRTASTPEQQAAAEDVANAEQAARQQDEPTMQRHLKNAGKWALDCAQTIGTDVLAEYLKKLTLG